MPNTSTTFTRLAVPTNSKESVTSGTYFRLGAYVATDEAAVLPGMKYSRSEVVPTTMTPVLSKDGAAEYNDPDYGLAQAQAVDPNQTSKVDNYAASGGGSLTTDSGTNTTNTGRTVRNTTRQFEELLLTIKKTDVDPLNYGLLAKSDGDLIANVKGGGLLKFEEGVALTTLNGDVNINAPKGTVSIASQNGVKITAGSAGKPANIALTAFGYVKQTSYGPYDDVRYSTSSVTTYGWQKEWFYGDKFFEIHGKNTSNLYGVDMRANFAQQLYSTFASKLSFAFGFNLDMAISLDIKINAGVSLSLGLAARWEYQAVYSMRNNMGTEIKVVGIMDVKSVPLDVKLCQIDFKVAEITASGTTLDAAKADLDTKVGALGVSRRQLSAATDTVEAKMGTLRNLM